MTGEFVGDRSDGGAGPVQGVDAEVCRGRTVALNASRRDAVAREQGREENSF